MRKQLMKLAMLPTVALSLVLWSCDTLDDPASRLTGPEVGVAGVSTSGNGFTVVKENDLSVGVVTGVIGSSGGKLMLGKHELWVPKDAVSAATTFTMTKVDGEQIRVKLDATQLTTNDIGSQGFAVPVKLTLSYDNAAELPQDESLLRIIWIRLDGTVQEQVSSVEVTGRRVHANLGHFSDYALAFP
jgi:hypothetical protein